MFSLLKAKYPEVKLLDHIVVLLLIFEKLPNSFPQWLIQIYIPTNNTQKFSFLYILTNSYCLLSWIMAILTSVRFHLTVVVICISLMTNDGEHLFMDLLTIYLSFMEQCLFILPIYLPIFKIRMFGYFSIELYE